MAGPGRSLTKQHPRQRFTAPILAGVAIVLVAALVVGVIVILDREGNGLVPGAAAGPATAEAEADTVRAAVTTNVLVEPNRFAEIVAILPGDGEARTLGRTSDGAWLRLAYPPDSSTRGWAPAPALRIDAATLERLPVLVTVAAPAPVAAGDGRPAAEPLPDLLIADAFLLQDGRLAVGIRNVGEAPLVERLVPLIVSKAAGDILGVLRSGPATLAPGASATVVTPVVVTETGSYLLQLDHADEIRESGEFNNSFTTLLIAGGD